MRAIGSIKWVQVQRSRLKKITPSGKIYDPAPLLVVASLDLTQEGVLGITNDGTQVIDVHHRSQAENTSARTSNIVSFNFTSHYQAIRDTYGDHVEYGCAGENILVETQPEFGLDDLAGGILIRDAQSGAFAYFDHVMVTEPCLDFSQYVLHTLPIDNKQQVKQALNFLRGGRRGFYARLHESHKSFIARAGNQIFALPRETSTNEILHIMAPTSYLEHAAGSTTHHRESRHF